MGPFCAAMGPSYHHAPRPGVRVCFEPALPTFSPGNLKSKNFFSAKHRCLYDRHRSECSGVGHERRYQLTVVRRVNLHTQGANKQRASLQRRRVRTSSFRSATDRQSDRQLAAKVRAYSTYILKNA